MDVCAEMGSGGGRESLGLEWKDGGRGAVTVCGGRSGHAGLWWSTPVPCGETEDELVVCGVAGCAVAWSARR